MTTNATIDELTNREEKMDMTPMIDCVFLLLVFFMCATKFKKLEKKLDAFLPDDAGISRPDPKPFLEPLRIKLTSQRGGTAAVIAVNGRTFGTATTSYTQSRAAVWGEVDHYLTTKIGRFEKVEIDADRDVAFQFVAQALNQCVKANLSYTRANPGAEPVKISFTGDMAGLAAARAGGLRGQ
jgi:biopolymer transport protein ExbD